MARRNLVILGVGPNEFLVRAEGEEADVREGLTRLIPGGTFELEPVNEKKAGQLESRLTDAQLKLIRNLGSEAGVRASRGFRTYRVNLHAPDTLVATATSSGVLKFNPRIAEVRKPLGGGIGPVGVTVGVGIAGKF